MGSFVCTAGAPMTDLGAIFKLGIIPTFASRGDRASAINLAKPNAECEYPLFTVAPREAHSSSPLDFHSNSHLFRTLPHKKTAMSERTGKITEFVPLTARTRNVH